MVDMNALRQRAEAGEPSACEELALQLLETSVPFTPSFHEGVDWLKKAAVSGEISALLALGQVAMQHPMLDDAATLAYESFADAARRGDPQAVERIADLMLIGYGCEQDRAKARSLYAQLADYAFPQLLCQGAYLLSHGIGGDVDHCAATDWLLRAAAQGHTLAFALCAHRYEYGLGAPCDPVIACAWQELAAARKFPGADAQLQRMVAGLRDDTAERAREFAEQLKSTLRRLGERVAAMELPEHDPEYLARFNVIVAENFAEGLPDTVSLDASRRTSGSQTVDGHGTPASRVVCWDPRVIHVRDFLDREEILYLLDASQPVLRSTADAVNPGTAVEVDAFDGECAIFPPYLVSPVMRMVVERFAELCHVSPDHFEPLSILRYQPGNEYSPHSDAFDAQRMEHYRAIGDLGGQRIGTCLAYLIKPERGGQTHYLHPDLTVEAEPGDAIIHYNATVEGCADPHSLHAGTPIEAGEKWLARTAFRAAPLYGDRYTRTV